MQVTFGRQPKGARAPKEMCSVVRLCKHVADREQTLDDVRGRIPISKTHRVGPLSFSATYISKQHVKQKSNPCTGNRTINDV